MVPRSPVGAMTVQYGCGMPSRVHPSIHLQGIQVRSGSINFSPDGNTLASGSYDGTVRLWMPHGCTQADTHRHIGEISSIAFSPDGTTLATGSSDEAYIRLWDPVTGDQKQRLVDIRIRLLALPSVVKVPCSPSGSRDGTVRLWDADTGAHKQTLVRHTGEFIRISVAFSPDRWTLASGSNDKILRLWECRHG